jgi:Zn-dependent protease
MAPIRSEGPDPVQEAGSTRRWPTQGGPIRRPAGESLPEKHGRSRIFQLQHLQMPGKVLVIVLLIVCLAVHEAAHAWVANLRGDSTAKDMGRMTINPIVHIDLFMTILLPAFLIFSGMPFLFGGAKPVPVNPHRLHHPMRDMMFVAIAGPASNFLLAALFFASLKYVNSTELFVGKQMPLILGACISFNIILTIFNLIPIPPLDGSRVMAYLLPSSLREPYVALERFGMLVIFGLMFTGFFGRVLRVAFEPMIRILDTITGGAW